MMKWQAADCDRCLFHKRRTVLEGSEALFNNSPNDALEH